MFTNSKLIFVNKKWPNELSVGYSLIQFIEMDGDLENDLNVFESAFERDMKLFNYENIKNKLFSCCQFHQKFVWQQFCEFEKKIEHNWFWEPP